MTGGNSHIHQFSNASGFTNTTNNSFVNSPGGPTSSSTQTTVTNSPNANNLNNNGSNMSNSNINGNNGNNSTANDFGFEFLDSLPGDPPFSAQDLLSSLDSTSNFNINDIL